MISLLYVTNSTVNPLLGPPGAYFFQALLRGGLNREGGLKERGGLFNLAKCINGTKVSPDGLVVTGRFTPFSNNKKMVTILHRELEHKIEKVKHMKKLEVMRPKTKNNMNFQPE